VLAPRRIRRRKFFDTIGYQYRTDSRYAPDKPDDQWRQGGWRQRSLYGINSYVIPKARPTLSGGTAVNTFNVDEHYSTYTYDGATGTYTKSEGSPRRMLMRASITRWRIEMVVVLHTREQLMDVGDGHGAHIHDYDPRHERPHRRLLQRPAVRGHVDLD